MVKSGDIVTGTVRDGTPHGKVIHITGADAGAFTGYYDVLTVPDSTSFTFSVLGSDPYPADGTYDTGTINVSMHAAVADYNVFVANNLSNNLANPGYPPVAGGYRAKTIGSLVSCGANSVFANNLGA